MTKIIQFIILTFFALGTKAQDFQSFSHERIVNTLADSSLKGRRAGTKEAKKTAVYLTDQLKKLSLTPLGENFTHSFEFKDISRSTRKDIEEAPKATGQNVIGFLDNDKDKTILIGAHYDHLGEGRHINSRSTSDSAIHFGADDNASGVALVLGILYELSTNNIQEDFNVIAAFFSAEEIGLLGSKAWLNDFGKSKKIDAMINLDMVGRMQNNTVQVFGYGTSKDWNPFVQSMGNDLNCKIDSSGLGPSDHATFYLDSIPVLHFFTGQHEDYHKETDTPDKLNYEGMDLLSSSIINGLKSIHPASSFAFLKTKDKTRGKRPKLKVTMGIMPSYSSGEEGMLIDGVIEGKSAHAAGMLKGDQIMKIGNHTVKDIYDYMDALSTYDKGDSTTVEVKRNKELITLHIQFK